MKQEIVQIPQGSTLETHGAGGKAPSPGVTSCRSRSGMGMLLCIKDQGYQSEKGCLYYPDPALEPLTP